AKQTAQNAQKPANVVDYATPDISQFSEWTTEQTGFAPYYEPEKGAWFAAIIRKCDMRDPNFIRYLMQASCMPVKCRRGPKPPEGIEDTRPVVDVLPGQHFSLSLFYSMVENLNTYIEYA